MTSDMSRIYDVDAPKRPVNMALNEDLVRCAREYTTNLSEQVESSWRTSSPANEGGVQRRMLDWTLQSRPGTTSTMFTETQGLTGRRLTASS